MGFLADLSSKAIAAIVGALLLLAFLGYVGHVRKENVRLTAENTKLVRNVQLLQENASLIIRIREKSELREKTLRTETALAIEELSHVQVPKLPKPCESLCTRTYDPIRAAFGVLGSAGGNHPAGAGAAVPRGAKPAAVQRHR